MLQINSIINENCATIQNQKQKISAEELQCLFDSIVLQLKISNNCSTDNYSKIVHTVKKLSGSILIDPLIIDHELFYFIQNFFIDLLNQWSTNEDLFQDIVDLFFKLIKHIKTTDQTSSSKFQKWFLNESFFQTIASVLEDLSINFHRYVYENNRMKSLTILIQSIQCFQNGNDQIGNHPSVLLLVDPMIKCLSSSIYTNTLKNLDIKSNTLSSFEDFLLRTIPCYSIWNRGKAQFLIINQLCLNHMLESYSQIYEFFLPSINDWDYSLMESIFHMTALLRYVAYYPSTRIYFHENLKIIDSILILLNSNCLLDNILITTDYNSQTNLTDSAISLIFNLTQDFQFLTFIKENFFFSKEIFLKLKHSKVDRVRLHAFMILAKILNEDDIQKLNHIDALVSVFFGYLVKAVNDPGHSFEDVPIEHLLVSLKAFVQHDEIKDEIVKENYFEFLIHCATERNLHVGLVLQISLEIIWALTFNSKIYRILIDKYEQFLSYLRTSLIHSDEQGVQAAAKGILWKLENESIVKKQILAKNETNSFDDKYDIMISYSHSNKDLCHQVHQNLIQSKYRVWLDFENMYGSTLQSMAQAIESSDIILICMSNPYKQSAYCRSEAEYAYTRQRQIIPLVMEKKYRPDGWLGFICASKMYVDFTKTDFEQAFVKLIAQIQLHQRHVSSSSIIKHEKKESLMHDDGVTSTVEIPKNPSRQLERASTIEYQYDRQYFEWWTHDDVLHFLQDKHLDIMRSLFEHDQQFDGQSLYILYEQCQSNTESTYQLLNSQLTQSHDHILPYLTFLRFISELRKQANPIGVKQVIRWLLWNIWKKIHQKFF